MDGRQFCGLEFWEPTYCTDDARLAAASWSQTRARQQVISVMESPRGTVRGLWGLVGWEEMERGREKRRGGESER